jgi:hypothetical protein
MSDGKPADGLCDSPGGTAKRILIRNSLKRNPERLLSVIFHELLHAGSWHLDEAFVEEASSEAARVAIALGFTFNESKD